jgi:endoglucanase
MRPVVVASLFVVACGGWQVTSDPAQRDEGAEGGAGGEGAEGSGATGNCELDTSAPPASAPMGLRVLGTRIEDASGNAVVLRGVNRSGSEYMCLRAEGFFDGPGFGPGAEASVRAMAAWNVNAVRIPLNESCWLAINGAPPAYSGEAYRRAIADYVALLQRYGMVPILDLHWAAPGSLPAVRLQPMPNADHSPEFWASVAETFLDNTGVVFELFNEPYPDFNRDTAEAWQCWRDGCEATRSGMQEGDGEPPTFAAAGMQALVDAVRGTGSRHVLLLGGVQYSNALSGWLEYKPEDPLDGLAAAWHVYNFNACNNSGCWDADPARVAANFPVVATEVGQNDCQGESFLKPLLGFLDTQGAGYLAWSWNAYGRCAPEMRPAQQGQPWSLVTDYACPVPNSDYALTFYDHLTEGAP